MYELLAAGNDLEAAESVARSLGGVCYLGDPDEMKQIYPDYVTMAKGFDVPAERVIYRRDLRAALQRMLDSDQPYVLDIIVPYTEHVLPFIPAGKTVADMIWKV